MNENTVSKKPSTVSERTNRSMYSFHLSLFSDNGEMYELWLPEIVEGFFRFSEESYLQFLSVYAKDGQWNAACRRPAFFSSVPMEECNTIILAENRLVEIEYQERMYSLYIEKVSEELLSFYSYSVMSDVEINIGSYIENDICYENPYVSKRHAVLTRSRNHWDIRDCGSAYGVYVNSARQEQAELKLGDVVFIMGLRIIIGSDFIAVNDKAGNVTIRSRALNNIMQGHGTSHYGYQQDFELEENRFFNRAPRKKRDFEPKTIVVEAPPMSMDQAKMPLMLRMGSSMVMGGYAALSGNMMTLLSSVLFPVLSSKYTDEQKKEYEKLRQTKYTEYLQQKRLEIEEACSEERIELNQKYPSLCDIIKQAPGKSHLWERRPMDNDFLQVRLGAGVRRLGAKINYPERHFELETDELQEKMYDLVEYPYILENTPVVLSFMETSICGLLGPRNQVVEYILRMVMQVAMFHSYDEVKMFFLVSEEDLEQLDFVRYLPHVWDDQKTIRFIATNEAEAYRLGEYIHGQSERELEKEEPIKAILKRRPFYLVFALEKKLLETHEVMKQILQTEQPVGIAVVAAYDDLPKETQKIITLVSDNRNTCTTLCADGGKDESFIKDQCSLDEVTDTLRLFANTHLKMNTQEEVLPKTVTFLEMLKTGKIEQLNALKRWKDSNPVTSLAAPVGVSADGSLFMLDLHEKRQGPHGLVAGMTGSGKSEFLITYILSMAVNYHPDEVAFVLIDYKGGGLAGAFENPKTGVRLPHLVGTITNLDGASIQRSLMSIESELLRRQKRFNEIKSIVNEGTMDIYSYQKLYRVGKVRKPMPHLFIVSDEFAELKQQQPEFMAQLISAARIGRSLGVHLILATQKPSGVVDDQIRSNTKFRVCLRVQERSDSMDMLKRPEAAELTDTGRFYLQVGYNELFAMGQSAWCGAPYEPKDVIKAQKDDVIEFLDIGGQVISKAKPKVRKVDSGKKQIVAVVEYLAALAASQGIQSRQLCQPELTKNLDLDLLQKQDPILNDPMTVRLGMLDDPENQLQMPLEMNFKTVQNMLIVGDGGSGKTTLVQNILLTMSRNLASNQLNFYVLDYSSRMMKLFKTMPHCGAVLYDEDVQSLDALFGIFASLVEERKELFTKLEVDSYDVACTLCDLPLVLVIVDNFSGLTSSKKGEDIAYRLPGYLKNCANYGIKFIVTCSHLNEVPSRVKQELQDRICLHMREKYDYGDVLGCKVEYQPMDIPGRGMCAVDGRPLEFQSAIYQAEFDGKQRIQKMKGLVSQRVKECYGQPKAQGLPVTDDTAEYLDFAAQFPKGRIPLGFSKATGKPVALPLKQYSALGLYFGNPQGTLPILQNVLYAAKREGMEVWVAKRNKNTLFDSQNAVHIDLDLLTNSDSVSCTLEELRLLQRGLLGEMTQRKAFLTKYCAEHGIPGEVDEIFTQVFPVLVQNFTPIMLVIESMEDFCTALNEMLSMGFLTLFKKAAMRGIYVVSCFEANISEVVNNNMLCSFFAEKELILFGGQLTKQNVCRMANKPGAEGVWAYNVALMQYRKHLYPMIMPCGKIENTSVDEDMEEIFN